ncbi:hypothetical protein Q8G38_16245 [Halomonas venusta]|uniref:hypothetical protein n=1 Tax=Vreelandella venusta TaxID=44935 RepID=UPI00295E32E2|nr:hypothetical protein [Halomonas venusta]MDW0360865.1 hypothetical protein [Halomonas venusta]
MKERPILFNAAMVNAIVEGRKTQTRRIVKTCRERGMQGPVVRGKQGEVATIGFAATAGLCPYGQTGDRLWVRETWSGEHHMSGIKPSRRVDYPDDTNYMPALPATWYWADGEPELGDWERPRPSIHMPRWASRITLEIVSVRVERLLSISDEDAIAEGCYTNDEYSDMAGEADVWPCQICDGYQVHEQGSLAGASEVDCHSCDSPKKRFNQLWQSINGFDSWDANPWVWVVEFRRVEQ